MHFRKIVSSDHLCAEDFTDRDFQPTEQVLTIKAITNEKPPAGGKPKGCFAFVETEKSAFLANGEIKKIARMLRKAYTEDWIGAKLTITCGPKRSPSGGGETTGMIVVKAEMPSPKKDPPNASK